MSHRLDLAYQTMRFLVWVIPTTGFIGTVVGISIALEGMQDPKNIEFEKMTSGLAVAFYTTIVALVLSAILVLLQNVVQRREEMALNRAAQYTLRNLGQTPRSWRAAGPSPQPTPSDRIDEALLTSAAQQAPGVTAFHEVRPCLLQPLDKGNIIRIVEVVPRRPARAAAHEMMPTTGFSLMLASREEQAGSRKARDYRGGALLGKAKPP
jgi:phosphate/sulfate permease